MKRSILYLFALVLLFSCTKESSIFPEESSLAINLENFDTSNFGTYRGTFTTLDSQYRATMDINILDKNIVMATIIFNTGTAIVIKAEEPLTEGIAATNVRFKDDSMAFNFSVGANGSNPKVTNVTYLEQPAHVFLIKETSLAPVTPVIGTYSCIDCGGHPFFEAGLEQTFNMVFTSPDAEGVVNTQVIAGGNTFLGGGDQYAPTAYDSFASSQMQSNYGTSLSTVRGGGGYGFYINGQGVYWWAEHIYKAGIATPADCSGVLGGWSFDTDLYGTINGELVSDSDCFNDWDTLDFETFAATGFDSPEPSGGFDSNLWRTSGWSDGDVPFGGTGLTGDFARGITDGSGISVNGIYAVQITPSNRFLAVQPAPGDFIPGELVYRIQNNTGQTIKAIEFNTDIWYNNNGDRLNGFVVAGSEDGISYYFLETARVTGPADADGWQLQEDFKIQRFGDIAPGDYYYIRITVTNTVSSGIADEFGVDNFILRALY